MITRGAAILTVLLALAVAGCGGGSTSSSNRSIAALPPRTAVSANANCRYLLRQAKALGKGVLLGNFNEIRQRINTMVVKPSLSLLETVANSQQALEPAAHSTQYDTYASLFNPIIVLTRERLAAGDAGNVPLSGEIERLMSSLGVTQEQTARRLGLGDCELDFQRILIDSLTA